MKESTTVSVPWSFWVIVTLALIWNVLGGLNFFGQMNSEVVATMPETHRAIIENRPAWATAGFAISVFGGGLGCLLLLLRKSAAFYILIASLLGTILTMIHTISIAISKINFSAFEMILMVLMPLLVAGFLITYSQQARNRRWIN